MITGKNVGRINLVIFSAGGGIHEEKGFSPLISEPSSILFSVERLFQHELDRKSSPAKEESINLLCWC